MLTPEVLTFLSSLGGPLALVGFALVLLTGLLRLSLDKVPAVGQADAAPMLRMLATYTFILGLVIILLGFLAYLAPQIQQMIRVAHLDPNARREFRTSMELFGEAGNTESTALVPTDTPFTDYQPINEEFTKPKRDSVAHTGKYSLNFIPNGNPPVKPTATINAIGSTVVISALLLDIPFDTSNSDTLSLTYFMYSTSNPRPSSINNCDSALNIFIKRDDHNWQHYDAECGSYKSENIGWHQINIDIPTDKAISMTVGFLYTLQANNVYDSDAKYLIDDLAVVVHPISSAG